jgi:hypothetical protein
MSAKRNARATAFAVALLVILAVPTGALAAPKVPGAEPVVLEFPAGELCSFPVRLTILDGQREHEDQGTVILTGPLTVTVTNLSSGASQTFNASGPTLVEPRSGALVLTGPSIILQPASLEVGEPFLIYHRGRVVFTANNDGILTIASITGETVDICAALS